MTIIFIKKFKFFVKKASTVLFDPIKKLFNLIKIIVLFTTIQ